MKALPYGISDFPRIMRKNYYYVDKSRYIEMIERQPSYLFLIRPRRFGKSLFLAMLETYYSIDYADSFEEIFGELYIGKHPTEEHNKYMVLRFNFSAISSKLEDVERSFCEYCCMVMKNFILKYEHLLGSDIWKVVNPDETNPRQMLSALKEYVSRTDCPRIYLLIDEYDNFTNTILSSYGQERYREKTHGEGFIRGFFNNIKDSTSNAGAAVERLFITGVSPITMDDVTSGFNIGTNISMMPQFNDIIGFSEDEVREMITYYKDENALPEDVTVDRLVELMKPWYDNYCFSSRKLEERMFNSDMTLYFLNSYLQQQLPPETMVDNNIRTDYSKLKMLARIDHDNTHEGSRMSTIEEIAAKGEILVDLHTSFPSEKIADIENFRSLLYYYGLLTMCGTRGDRLKMCIPNNCVREQYLGFLRDYYQQAHTLNLSHLKDLIDDFAFDGHWQPFFETIARAYRENSSIRDAIEGERNLQGFLKAYLAIASYYLVQPELEMNYGYCDFFLLPDKMRYSDIEHSYILELKYATRTATNAELEAQAEEGRQQLLRYSKDKVVQKLATGTTLHLLLIQFQGWDMVKCEEINASAIHPSE